MCYILGYFLSCGFSGHFYLGIFLMVSDDKENWQKTLDYVKERFASIDKAIERGIPFILGDLVRLKSDANATLYKVIKVRPSKQKVRLLHIQLNRGFDADISNVELVGRPLFPNG